MKFGSAALQILLAGVLFAAVPSSSSYKLESYGMGSGGSAASNSTTYSSSTITGQQGNAGATSSTTYTGRTGLIPTQLAFVPSAPTLTNPSSYYNKLHIVINNGSNPSDATFAIAISPNAFASTTNYVQSDFTVGAVLGPEDWLTYSGWGSTTGIDIIGLLPNTTYTIKVKAEHGNFTESAFSATASAATISPSLTFDIDVSASDTETGSPYSLSLGSLTPNSVISGSSRIWIDLDTNAQSGGTVFIASQNVGLKSTATTHTIASLSTDLTSVNEGFGAQNASVTQTTGGPLSAQAPYTGGAQNVGITDTLLRSIYASSAPITGGRASVLLKARSTTSTPAALDYADVLTLVASASF